MSLDIIKHKNILLQILKDIYTDSLLGPVLGFKGGTAAYLFYNLERFSVDLDFDLLDASQVEGVFAKIQTICEKYGVVKKATDKRNTIFILLSYGEQAHNVKVEINKRNFRSKYELKNYLGIPMQVMVKRDMFAHKLVAMTERNQLTNRDLFDVWFFLKNNWDINTRVVEGRTGMKFTEYLEKCISFVNKIPSRGILSGIGELLDNKQKGWVKSKLKDDLLFLLKVLLEDETKKQF